ncbi:MAG: VCBS repeat-containing protein [Candidatus Lernaella stagnicola]|nr:VCBS repeat-containing protein [Candidatus Lernaella stagnicola]
MKRVLCIAILVLMTAYGTAWAGGFVRHDLTVDGKIHQVVAVDVNGDDAKDLLIAYAKNDRRRAAARIAVVMAGDGFAAPRLDIALPADACLWDTADVNGDGIAELIVLRKWSVVSRPLAKTEAATWTTLAKQGTGVLFPPDDGAVGTMDFARDWTGDGTWEIVVPDYGALVFLRADGASFKRAFTVTLPVDGWMRVESDPGQAASGERIVAGLELPQIFTVPTGRGHELFLVKDEAVTRHALTEQGVFAKQGKTQRFEFLTEQERQAGNMSVISRTDDLNGDGYPDLMLNKIGGGLSTFRSAVRVYAGTPTGFAETPAFSFESDGFASMVHFRDLDGDGNKEMYLPYADFGLAQLVRMLTTKKVKLKAQIYRGAAGLYADKPTLSRSATFHVTTERGMDFRGYPPNFNGDFDGDGLNDLLMESGDGFGVYRNEGGLKFGGTSMMQYNLSPREHLLLADVNADGKSDCILWDTFDPAQRGQVVVLVNEQ